MVERERERERVGVGVGREILGFVSNPSRGEEVIFDSNPNMEDLLFFISTL